MITNYYSQSRSQGAEELFVMTRFIRPSNDGLLDSTEWKQRRRVVSTVKFNYNQQWRSQITPLRPVSWSWSSLVFGLSVVEIWPWKIWVRDKITRPMYISKRINPLLIWVSLLCAAVWLTILSITLGSIEPTATIAENTTFATAGPLYTVAFKSEPRNNKNNKNGKSNGNNGSPVAKRKWNSYGSSSLVSFCGWCLLFSATTVSLHIVA